MKRSKLKRNRIGFQNLIIVIIVISLNSCNQSNDIAPMKRIEISQDTVTSISLDNYKVILATDENIYMNETGELRVWIGPEGVNVSFSESMITDETTIPGSAGQYAKITPFAPDFEVSPLEMTCIRIDPSGSDVRFLLRPTKSGTLKVSANIELFNNASCTGPPVPKTAKTLTVNTKINKTYLITNGAKKMAIILWEKFLSFWGVLIALLFSTLLFLIRRKIKRKTGFDDKEENV